MVNPRLHPRSYLAVADNEESADVRSPPPTDERLVSTKSEPKPAIRRSCAAASILRRMAKPPASQFDRYGGLSRSLGPLDFCTPVDFDLNGKGKGKEAYVHTSIARLSQLDPTTPMTIG